MGRFSKEAIATLIVSAFVMFAVACSSNHPNDEAIAQDIQAKVAADPATRDAAVSVTAKDGKVSLKGSVKDTASQQRLEQIAREAPGATGVDDQTAVVADPASAPEQAASTPAPTASTQTAPPPPREAPKPKPIVVPAGTPVTVTVDQALSSKTSKSGETFLATVAQPVTVNGTTVIPKGASATGTVVAAKSKGKIKGEGQLSITLTGVAIHGKNYPIQTVNLDSTVKGKGKRTAATTGGGAAGGALIGGLAGGGKGAGIGALVGAGAGLVGGAFTGNKQIEIPAETALTFTLANPLTLTPRKE
jgi:BON domain